MILVCSNCSTRLQVDDAKVPSRPFTVRCPKCQNIINGQPPASEGAPSALAAGSSPATENPRFEQSAPSPAFKLEQPADEKDVDAYSAQTQPSPQADANELMRLLTMLLQRGVSSQEKAREAGRLAWEKRRVLICVRLPYGEYIARKLSESDYHVFVAENTTQALERMREQRMDIVILEPEFDPVEQGAAFVTREINNLRQAERRRLFFVQFSHTARTMDQHAAFINNVNLTVNPKDLDQLPRTLERVIRDYNDLYRNMNNALHLAPI